MRSSRCATLVCVLVVMAGAFWVLPLVSDFLLGTKDVERIPLPAVATVLFVTAAVGLLAHRVAWWIRGVCCALVGGLILLFWPYPHDSDFLWTLLWLVSSGALAVAVLGAFTFGALASRGPWPASSTAG